MVSVALRKPLSAKAAVRGTQGKLAAARVSGLGSGALVMRKEGIHPDWHEDVPVYCNGELVMTVAGTKEQYDVELWSGNHPFYQGKQGKLITDDGQITKFNTKFDELEDLFGMVDDDDTPAPSK